MSVVGAHTLGAMADSRRRVPFANITNVDADAGGGDGGAVQPGFPCEPSVHACPSATTRHANMPLGHGVGKSSTAQLLQGRHPSSAGGAAAAADGHYTTDINGRGDKATNDQQVVMSSVQVSTPDAGDGPRKFLQNYFFLKTLNILPLTPDKKNRKQNPPLFRRSSVCDSAPASTAPVPFPPPPPRPSSSSSSSHPTDSLGSVSEQNSTGQRFVRQHGCSTSTKPSLSSVDALPPTEQQCSMAADFCCMNSSGGGGDAAAKPAQISVKRPPPVALQAFLEHPPTPIAGPLARESMSSSAILNKTSDAVMEGGEIDGEDHCSEASGNSLMPHGQTKDMMCDSHNPPEVRELSCCECIVDVNGAHVVHGEEVLIHVDNLSLISSLASPSTVATELRVNWWTLAQMNSRVSVFGEGNAEPHARDVEEMIFGQGNPSYVDFLSSASVFSHTDHPYRVFEEFLFIYYEEQFKVYKAHLLGMAFTTMYVHMVAIPAVKMLEFYGRLLICCRRDLGIRSMIELFCVTSKWLYRRRRCVPAPTIVSRQHARLFPLPQQTGAVAMHSGNRDGRRTSYALGGGRRIHDGSNRVRLGQCGESRREGAADVAPQLSVKRPSTPRRFTAHQVVRPIMRPRTPKKLPTGEDLMDIMNLPPR